MSPSGEVGFDAKLRYWAACLGWSGLEEQHSPHDPPVVWYTCGSDDDGPHYAALYVFIGSNNVDSVFSAAVYAIRYRLFSGLRDFVLPSDRAAIGHEAQRLSDFLHKKWFTSRLMRRAYRSQHPECSGYSWSRIRKERPVKYGLLGEMY